MKKTPSFLLLSESQQLYSAIKETLTQHLFKGRQSLNAIRMTLAVLLTYIICWWFEVPHPWFAGIAAMMSYYTGVGGLFYNSYLFLLGTVIGGLVGLLANAVVGETHLLFILAGVLLSAIGIYFREAALMHNAFGHWFTYTLVLVMFGEVEAENKG